MYVDQENTIDKMLKDYNMWDCKPASFPADPNAQLKARSKPKSKDEKEEGKKRVGRRRRTQ